MGKAAARISETPATQFLRRQGVAFSEHVYAYVEHGGTAELARQLGLPEHRVVKTLVLTLDRIWINGGRGGYLVGLDPALLPALVGARAVQCASAE